MHSPKSRLSGDEWVDDLLNRNGHRNKLNSPSNHSTKINTNFNTFISNDANANFTFRNKNYNSSFKSSNVLGDSTSSKAKSLIDPISKANYYNYTHISNNLTKSNNTNMPSSNKYGTFTNNNISNQNFTNNNISNHPSQSINKNDLQLNYQYNQSNNKLNSYHSPDRKNNKIQNSEKEIKGAFE